MLNRFDRWFGSAAGVVQTLVLVLAVVVAEATGLIRDDHGFWLLYWLTVYSAITQPILAYSNRRSVADQASREDLVLELERRILAKLDR
jgi:hypothetical protein